eukprot:1275511-Rhodomonas_salina.1
MMYDSIRGTVLGSVPGSVRDNIRDTEVRSVCDCIRDTVCDTVVGSELDGVLSDDAYLIAKPTRAR